MIKYFKNFLRIIPTWVICVFIFFWIYKWTFIVGIFLMAIQAIQIKKTRKRIDDYESLLNDYDELSSQYEESESEYKKLYKVYKETISGYVDINCVDIRQESDGGKDCETEENQNKNRDSDAKNKENEKENTEIENKNDGIEEKFVYQFPPLDLLNKGENNNIEYEKLREIAHALEQILKSFGVYCTVINMTQSPLALRFELQMNVGTRISKIKGLSNDIRLNLAVKEIRIEAPIPGKAAIAIEIPNEKRPIVALRDLLETKDFKCFPSKLPLVVGKDIYGNGVISDIEKMPHLLISGTTGSGKSVFIDCIITGVIYKSHPDDVKMILIDSKGVTLSAYNGIPHLLIPVVTDARKAGAALHWCVAEMTERYKKFSDLDVKNLNGYNEKIEYLKNECDYNKLPQILVIVDDLSDLMAVNEKEIEDSIIRLAQMSRAAGIHIIVSTQRPSIDVITGLIKSNIPSRVAFRVFSAIDSRVILDEKGAEELRGNGDMLFKPIGYPRPTHIQGAFVSYKEIANVVDFFKNQAKKYEKISYSEKQINNIENFRNINEYDECFEEAGRFIIEKNKASIGMLQRYFKIGFNRAFRIMDELCEIGVVEEEQGTKPRKVIMNLEDFEHYIEKSKIK